MTLTSPESHQLQVEIKSAKSGDKDARDRLALLLYPILKDTIKCFYTDLDDQDSAIGAIILKLLVAIDTIKDDHCPLPFIKTTARNFCVDEKRKDSHRRHRINNGVNLKASEALDVNTTVDEVFGVHAPIIRMRFIEGKTIQEITKALNLPRKTVRYQVSTAYFKCMEYLYQ